MSFEGFITAYGNLMIINNNKDVEETGFNHLPPLVKKETPSILTESHPVELLKKKPSITPLYPTANMDLSKCLDTGDPPHLINKVTGEIYKVQYRHYPVCKIAKKQSEGVHFC